MEFTVIAVESGKTVMVRDRVAQQTVFNRFLDPNESATVRVASNDGQTGNVDVLKALNGPANTVHLGDYDVRAGEQVAVDD